MAVTGVFSVASLRPKAPFDTNPPPNLALMGTHKPKPASSSSRAAVVEPLKEEILSSHLRDSRPVLRKQGKLDENRETYLGYDTWLPVLPKVNKSNKPRSVSNAASLAYLGDCIYELYARRHFLYPPLSIDVYNGRVMSIVRCEAQDNLLKKLLEGDFLTEEERDILRWGRNSASNKTRRTRKRAGIAVYSRASSLETLIGHLYLTDVKRLEGLMQKLGFAAGCSSDMIIEKKAGQLKSNKESPNSDDLKDSEKSDLE